MKKRILVADDNESVRKMVARVLESAGYSTVLAQSCQDAVAELRQECADLVLLDLDLQGEAGWEILNQICGPERIPVVAMTAWPDQSEHAIRGGAEAVLQKPLDLPLLLETIWGLVGELRGNHSIAASAKSSNSL